MNGGGARQGAPDHDSNSTRHTVPERRDEIALVDIRIEVHGEGAAQIYERLNLLLEDIRQSGVPGIVLRYSTLKRPHPKQTVSPTVYPGRRAA